jgi:hypothetical protein
MAALDGRIAHQDDIPPRPEAIRRSIAQALKVAFNGLGLRFGAMTRQGLCREYCE